MIWNAKKNLYNFRVLSFERYPLHQGRNWAWNCCTCTTDVLEHSLAWNSNTQICCGLFSEVSRSGASLSLPSSLTSSLCFHHALTSLNFYSWSKETEALESIKLWDLICFYCSIYVLNIGCSSVPIFMIVSFNY